MKRRTFILSLVGGSALGWTGWKNDFFGSSPRAPLPSLAKFGRSTRALGTDVSITVFHPNPEEADKVIQKAFQELELIEDLMSLYRPDSQLCRLNSHRTLNSPHPYLKQILNAAAQVSKLTDGAFDITIQPLYRLFAESGSGGPSPQTVERTRKAVGWQGVTTTDHSITLDHPKAAITLNGIAQGFASDILTQVLKSHGIEHALIDSGEIGILGTHADDRPWSVGIKHPRQSGGLLGLTSLEGRCLATSGDYETRFGDGFDLHHLLDPRTGSPANDLSSVTVAAPTATMADALSTAVFILGLRRGKELIQGLADSDALFVSKAGEVSKTRNFPFLI